MLKLLIFLNSNYGYWILSLNFVVFSTVQQKHKSLLLFQQKPSHMLRVSWSVEFSSTQGSFANQDHTFQLNYKIVHSEGFRVNEVLQPFRFTFSFEKLIGTHNIRVWVNFCHWLHIFCFFHCFVFCFNVLLTTVQEKSVCGAMKTMSM